ncbi:MAG: aminopeptidase P N-terminal domain-containing protein [Gemmatimonadetes bacterium]|nr:aminopeptidase P N-terminal domain-containing protein [Gemmatimonadota bacterium]
MTRFPRVVVLAVLAALAAPRPSAAQAAVSEYAMRRQKLMAALGDGALVVNGAEEPKEDYMSFWQSPEMDYLTGFREPGAKLVIVRQGATQTEFLFAADKDPAREVWTGNRLGPARAGQATGTTGRSLSEFTKVVDSLAGKVARVFTLGDEAVATQMKQKNATIASSDASRALQQLRGTKSEAELACIRRAVDVTVDAQKLAMRAVRPDAGEYEVQGLIEYTFRRNGADRPSFATIVGSGPNSATLHYGANSRQMKAGDIVVMDIGASFAGYAADVTRTVPVNGTYSPAQRDIYQIVRDAQAAAEKAAVPGGPARAMSQAASKVLAEGLARVGLITAPDATYDCGNGKKCSQLSLYYMHGLGHGIGLEVHDPDQHYFTGTLAPGSAFTIEPGIYVRENLLEILPDTPGNKALVASIAKAHARYKNIGVRIEDDYVITASGLEWISKAPREMAEIEALMKQGPAMLSTAQAPVETSCAPPKVQP